MNHPRFGVLLKFVQLAMAVVGILAMLAAIAGAPRFVLNDGRLTPTFSILAGNPPYFPLDHGLVLNTCYAPLSYFYYIPCALFGHDITWTICFGSLMSLAAFMIPLVLVIRHGRKAGWDAVGFWLLILGGFQILGLGSLDYSAFAIHADAPAVLFSSLCVLLLAPRREGDAVSARALFASAVFGVAAAWTKQTYAAVSVLPLLVAVLDRNPWGRRLTLAAWIGLLHACLFAVFALWCGKDALLDNIVKVPKVFPTHDVGFLYSIPVAGGGHLRSVVVAMHILTGKYLTPYLLGLALCSLLMLRPGGVRTAEFPLQLPRLSRLCFGLAAMNLPMSASVALASGASVNSDTPFAWFFVLGIVALLAQPFSPNALAPFPGAIRVVGLVFTALAMAAFLSAAAHLPASFKTLARVRSNDEAALVQHCRTEPDAYYFPNHPLAEYLATGRLFNYMYMVDCRSALRTPAPDDFRRHIPAKFTLIGFPPGFCDADAMTNYLGPLPACAPPAWAANLDLQWNSLGSPR